MYGNPYYWNVALLAEGVDRNYENFVKQCEKSVALLAEGVDRNQGETRLENRVTASPSSRRAWIEIIDIQGFFLAHRVALLAEGVDRNH